MFHKVTFHLKIICCGDLSAAIDFGSLFIIRRSSASHSAVSKEESNYGFTLLVFIVHSAEINERRITERNLSAALVGFLVVAAAGYSN